MKKILQNLHFLHKSFWNKQKFKSLFYGVLLLIISLIVQSFADSYVLKTQGTLVGDLLLNNIKVYDIDGFIMGSALIYTFLIIILILLKPKYIIFTIKSLALFIITRSFFISLTHLGVHPEEIIFNSDSFWFGLYDLLYNSKNDFFFSGHTGIPFLIALIFYKEKFWRNIFFVISFVFGISVIVGHMHYSIDVFAAPLITFSIYSMSKNIFKKDYNLIKF